MTNIFGGEIDVDEQYDLKGKTNTKQEQDDLSFSFWWVE